MSINSAESQQGVPATDRLAAVLLTERNSLAKRLASLRKQSEALAQEQNEVEGRLGHIDALLNEQGANQSHDGELGTTAPERSLADEVVQLLQEHGNPLHYREIASRLRERGVELPKGKDLAANLLAHFFNDPRVYRPRRGTYALREGRVVQSVGTRRARSRKPTGS